VGSLGLKSECPFLFHDTLASAGELPLEKHVAVLAALIRPVLLWVIRVDFGMSAPGPVRG
jgi:hypothetical protein